MADIQKNTVATPCSAYNAMLLRWALIDDLLGGTIVMRAAGEKWLPKEPKEEVLSYDNRLNRSILFEAYGDTIDDLVSRPFSKPVSIQGDLPERLAPMVDNCDGQGTDITQYARELFETCLNRGKTHILVDYPKTTQADGKKLTLADEKKAGVRPVFVHIKPDNLIGWRTVQGTDGKPKLDQIRWKESHVEPDGVYGEKAVNTIRVYTATTWEVHTADDKGVYTLTEQGTHTYPNGIPLFTCYVNKTGFMTANPPLEGLAWLNLAHWQGYSDQKNLLRFIRFPLLFFKGLTQDELDKNVIIGPGRKYSSSNPEADAKYVEHTGAAADSGRQDLKDIEERMVMAGLDPLMTRSGNQTATSQDIDESKSQSSVQSWVRAVELVLLNAFKAACLWTGDELPEDFKVDIYNDFGISVRATRDIDALIKARQAGELSRGTFLREIKRRAVLSETVDIEQEKKDIEAEGIALGMLGRGDNE
ncbi:MAG TPA: hypothetical protein DDW84_01380 [Phycisphaerales bacterium]|nr:MAG: hypothetical protein A2Y13_01175 [Planctomycetes bacterium GWC2_45_44]HBG77488.1 hypothetical protein [Phycisphaerales bacterium]HBR19096.1 hypothetical protein [Phycisphaerales bacterium]